MLSGDNTEIFPLILAIVVVNKTSNRNNSLLFRIGALHSPKFSTVVGPSSTSSRSDLSTKRSNTVKTDDVIYG
jgi:hypothetical protein